MSEKYENYKNMLVEHNKLIKEELQMIQEGSYLSSLPRQIKPKEKQLRADLMQLAHEVAHTGQLHPHLWSEFKYFLAILIKEVLDRFYTQYQDSKSFEEEKQVILQCLIVFEKPPFTIQRITELTLDPTKYYKSCRKIVYAFERLVNVTNPENNK